MQSVPQMPTDYHREWPRWAARLANHVPLVRWTKHYCVGGCGYPVTGAISTCIDMVEGVPVQAFVCQLNGRCEYVAQHEIVDEEGNRYMHVRPEFVAALRDLGPDDRPSHFIFSFSK